ncbi:MAG: pyrroline-5-carboxylate reductase [Woeseiaceae bacterium]|nr:pyrroline-5-carboxylate reductase [Woeseiaceae bacterium]
MTQSRIGFIGGGNMARAIAAGMLDSGVAAGGLLIADPDADARRRLADALPGVTVTSDNDAVVRASDCVVLAVKPQVMPEVCDALSAVVQPHKPLIVSIAAGVRSDDIDRWLGGDLAVVRVMPNQPALLRRGISGLYANARTSAAQLERATGIMAAVGDVVTVDTESDLDAVTAVSGSGPAYFFVLIDALRQSAVDLGLDPAAARRLAVETARGAAELALHEKAGLDELIARVRSPGGTTEAALEVLDRENVRAIFSRAITAARDRSAELGRPHDTDRN